MSTITHVPMLVDISDEWTADCGFLGGPGPLASVRLQSPSHATRPARTVTVGIDLDKGTLLGPEVSGHASLDEVVRLMNDERRRLLFADADPARSLTDHVPCQFRSCALCGPSLPEVAPEIDPIKRAEQSEYDLAAERSTSSRLRRERDERMADAGIESIYLEMEADNAHTWARAVLALSEKLAAERERLDEDRYRVQYFFGRLIEEREAHTATGTALGERIARIAELEETLRLEREAHAATRTLTYHELLGERESRQRAEAERDAAQRAHVECQTVRDGYRLEWEKEREAHAATRADRDANHAAWLSEWKEAREALGLAGDHTDGKAVVEEALRLRESLRLERERADALVARIRAYNVMRSIYVGTETCLAWEAVLLAKEEIQRARAAESKGETR